MEQTLGKRIVTHRRRLGLPQDQLACDVSFGAVTVRYI